MSGETMKLAMTFTAVDAASGYLAGLERRIDSLGEAGKKLRTEYDQMRGNFAEGLKGFGVAFTTMQFMKPGIEAAAMLESSGLSVKNSLTASGKAVNTMAAEFRSMRSTALYLSAHSPFAAPDIMRAEKLLLDSGFKPGEIAGGNGLAAQVAGMSQMSGQSMEAVREMTEIVSQQFGGGAGGIGGAFDWISQSGMEDKLPELATGLASMGTRAAAMKIPVKDAITTISMLEHVARRSGGAIGAFLKSTRPDATSSQAVRMRDSGLNFYDGKGNFIGMEATQKMLKGKFGGVQGDRMKMLESIFGEGAIAAEGLIKADNLTEINNQNERNLKLQEKVKSLNNGLANSYQEMIQSMRNSGGSVFAPITGMLSAASRGGRNAFTWLGQLAEDHPKMAKGLAGVGGAVAAGGALYGLLKMGQALGGFSSITSGLASTGVGIAAGKALEKTAGITPVFVTNWPGSSGGAFSTGAEKILGGAIPGVGAAALAAPSIIPTLAALSAPLAAYGGYKTGEAISEHVRRINWDKMSGAGAMQLHDTAPKININFNVDRDGRLTATTDNGDLTVNRGNFSHGH